MVKAEIKHRLAGSLARTVFLDIDDKPRPEWTYGPQTTGHTYLAQAIPPETPLESIFDQPAVGGQLLIVGEPGAGKTTALLQLADVLARRAEAHLEKPIPVLLDVLSWQNSVAGQRAFIGTFENWLAQALKKYGLHPSVSRMLLARGKLLPLLDGLDELSPSHQASCVAAIQTWIACPNFGAGVVACAALPPAEMASDVPQLQLKGAICAQPVRREQIRQYLETFAQSGVWYEVCDDSDLIDLLKTPLLINVFALVHTEMDLVRWRQLPDRAAKLNALLDAYVGHQLHSLSARLDAYVRQQLYESTVPNGLGDRKAAGRTLSHLHLPSARQTRLWLTWLAEQLQVQAQSEFCVSEMRPSLLQTHNEKLLYGCILGAVAGLYTGLFFSIVTSLLAGLGLGLLVGWAVGLLYGGLLGSVSVKSVSSLRVGTWRVVRWRFFKALRRMTMLWGVAIAVTFINISARQLFPQTLTPVSSAQLPVAESSLLLQNALGLVMFAFLCGHIFVSGLWSWLQHFTLRYILHRGGKIPWDYTQFLDYCTERGLLQRVGDITNAHDAIRYRFSHKMLQTYFSSMGLNTGGNQRRFNKVS